MHKFAVHATLWLNISSIELEDYQKVSEALSCLLVNICLNFGPFSNKSQYWLLWLRQMFVELWIRKEILWVFIPCDIHRGWHIQQQQPFFFPAFCHSWIPTAGHQHSSYLFLTWALPFQHLVGLQKHTTHLLKLKVTFVKKSVYIEILCPW